MACGQSVATGDAAFCGTGGTDDHAAPSCTTEADCTGLPGSRCMDWGNGLVCYLECAL